MQTTNRGGPTMTRAAFLKGGLALTALSIACPGGVRAAQNDAAGVDEVAEGVFVHRGVNALSSAENQGDICNISFVVGTNGVAVIDTGGSAKIGAHFHAALREKTKLPITHIISTHMHPDHVLGNGAFAADKPVFAGHHKLLRALAERSEGYLEAAKDQLGEEAFAGTTVILPTLGIETQTKIDLGGRELVLTPRPTAHTNNDLTIFDTRSETLFTGDLVFSEHLPTLDGSLRGWLKLLDVIEKEPAARIVPGHGPPHLAWPAGGADVRRYLETLAADVRKSIAAGKTMSDAMQTCAQSERDRWQLFDEHNARNVSAAFAELEWE